jgi:hypothetical protein
MNRYHPPHVSRSVRKNLTAWRLCSTRRCLFAGGWASTKLPNPLTMSSLVEHHRSTSCNANLCGCVPAEMATYQTSEVLQGTHLGTLCLPGRRVKSSRCAGGSDSDSDAGSDSDDVDWSLIRTYHGQVVPPATWPWVRQCTPDPTTHLATMLRSTRGSPFFHQCVLGTCLAQICGQQSVGIADVVVGAVNRSTDRLISDETRRTSQTTHGRSGALFSTGSHSNRPDGADIGLPTGAVTWLPDGRDGATVHPGLATQSADNCIQVRCTFLAPSALSYAHSIHRWLKPRSIRRFR